MRAMKLPLNTIFGATGPNLALALLLWAAVSTICACGGVQEQDRGPRGTLRFKGTPPDAVVEIDEALLGPIRMFEKNGVLLRPGQHRVIVRADGYFTEYRLVEVLKDGLVKIEFDLRPVPQ